MPVPPKSSCWFCPFKKITEWQDLLQNHPDLFKKAEEFEEILRQRGLELGSGEVFFTDKKVPLREALGLKDDDLYEDCSGHCMT
jgi:hypothetical protein